MSENPPTATPPTASKRLMSLDALRGFDMFWIIGAEPLVEALNRLSPSAPTRFLAGQLEHAEWQGFHFYDFIFPLFVFMVGAAIVFSLTKIIAESGRVGAVGRVLRRGVLLYVIGVFYSGGFSSPWPDIRLLGVLNRIALAYTFAGLLFICFKPRALIAICGALLVGYWAMMTFIPIRDIQLEKDNLAALAEKAGDTQLAQKFREADADSARQSRPASKTARSGRPPNRCTRARRITSAASSEKATTSPIISTLLICPANSGICSGIRKAILSTIPAVATCLLGVFAGLILRGTEFSNDRKLLWLIGGGIACVALGWLWGLQFPVIKKIWTSSYVLVAGGYSSILLGVFYLIVDVWKYQAWCQPFVWMGMNSITIYLTKNMLGGSFSKLATRLAGGDIQSYLDAHVAQGFGDLVISIVGLLLAFWFVRFLYKRKIFLRL